MQVIRHTSSGLQSLDLEAVLLDQRKIFLTDTITAASATRIVQRLLFLESMDQEEPIKLIINSPGGEVYAGLLIMDQIRGMKQTPIEIYCMELAASMAALILASGKHGRYILRHSQVMLHEPLISSASGGLTGSASSISKTADSIMQVKRDLVELLAQDTGRSREEAEAAMSFDNYMNAEEAVSFGICDRIVERI